MGGNLQVLLGAERLQRTLAMRMLRVASASVLAIATLLLWLAAEPTAPRAHDIGASSAVTSAATHDVGSSVASARPITSPKAARSARVHGRHQFVARSRATDGDGDPTPTSALTFSPAALFGDIENSARACLRRLALGHAPYGEPSPFDATAPPTSSPRNG
jgi:hypothetical protein